MDYKTIFQTLFISAISAATGYLIYTKTGTTTGIITTFMAGWILFQFRSLEKTWSSMGNFQNPILFGVNTAFAAFIFSTFKQIPSGKSLQISIGAFMLGMVISFMITKYWNMGP
jgi:uncharacterized membrane protein YczE